MRREHGARGLHFAPSYPNKSNMPFKGGLRNKGLPFTFVVELPDVNLNLFLFFIDFDFDDVRSGAMRREQK